MIRKHLFGLMDYLLLSEEERYFYNLTGRLPLERSDDVKIEAARTKPPINKGGRPSKTYHINERRAYCLWLIAKEMSEDKRAKTTNRKLIELAKKMSPDKIITMATRQTHSFSCVVVSSRVMSKFKKTKSSGTENWG